MNLWLATCNGVLDDVINAKPGGVIRVRNLEDIQMCVVQRVGFPPPKYNESSQQLAAYKAMQEAKPDNCTQCGAKSFRLISDHGRWKHICSYCGSDK